MTAEDREKWLSDFWEDANKSSLKIPFYLLAHLRSTLRAVRYSSELPRLHALLSDAPEGKVLRECLERVCLAKVLRLGKTGACVLAIPSNPADYSSGSSKQTLRRKVRSAIKSGIVCRNITDPEQQRALSEKIDQNERDKSNPIYQNKDADSSGLVGLGLWTAAFGEGGEPLAVAVTPFDGDFALLQKFISLGDTSQHSDARYMLHQTVVERLAHQRVRYLFDTRSPAELPNGLRHYQRMLGFRIARIDVSDASSMFQRARRTRTLHWVVNGSRTVKLATTCALFLCSDTVFDVM